jgi:uncharacterized membrane protein
MEEQNSGMSPKTIAIISHLTIIGIATFIFWIISLIGTANGEKKLVPLLGEYFQDWFKSL